MDVVREVPAELKRLVKCVVRGFYPMDVGIVVDALIKHQCVQEEALANHLHLDRKQLRQAITMLRQDKLVQSRQRMETAPDGKSQSQSYYYINYQLFVNVVKYKLDFMRRKIETEERESTSRASFKCVGCGKCFTDLETNQIMDFATGELRCHHCGASVRDSSSERTSETPQQLLLKFNEQIEPLFALIREVENVRLAPELLDPEPQEIRVRGKSKKTNTGDQNGHPGGWSGDATRFAAAVVTVGEEAPVTMRETKEIPQWLQKSTIVVNEPNFDFLHEKSSNPFSTYEPRTATYQEVMDLLLSHERQPEAGHEKESEEEDDELFEEVPESTTFVRVAGEPVAIQDITQELVNKMSGEEKNYYIALASQIYAAVHE